jgi:hypothetical protein
MSNLISLDYTYAVVGASHNKEKYGHRVFRDLLRAGYEVYPVNPRGGELLGKQVYPDLNSIPQKIDVVVMVVPPKVAQTILLQVKVLNITKVWFQPGSESDEAIQFCQEHGIDYMHNSCLIMERREQ